MLNKRQMKKLARFLIRAGKTIGAIIILIAWAVVIFLIAGLLSNIDGQTGVYSRIEKEHDTKYIQYYERTVE